MDTSLIFHSPHSSTTYPSNPHLKTIIKSPSTQTTSQLVTWTNTPHPHFEKPSFRCTSREVVVEDTWKTKATIKMAMERTVKTSKIHIWLYST